MKNIVRAVLVCLSLVFFAHPSYAEASHEKHESAAATQAQTTVVNINTADANTIADAHLKGIAKKRAEAIVAYRQQHGPFKSVDDLKNIKGLSQKYIDANRDRLTVN